jgi:hypothetical protein
LEFQGGLNVICGASDTGKSFVVEAIDFLLGTGSPLKDIPERVGYDRTRLVIQPTGHEVITLERSTGGGNYILFNEDVLSGEPGAEGKTLRINPLPGTNESLSIYLLSLIGLSNKFLQRTKQGETKRLGFRDLVKMVLVREEDIIKRTSPILSGQYTLATAEYSLFKLLLTGVDASGLRADAELTAELATTRQSNSTKAEFIDELLLELRTELSELGITRAEAEGRLSAVEAASQRQQEVLSKMQGALDERIARRRALMDQLGGLSGRGDEISGLLARFDLLKAHYHVDLERLAAIEESGSLFVHLEQQACPLCGATPDNQHRGEGCDGDVESVIRAATAEIEKVKKLARELDQTVADLRAEHEDLAAQKAQLVPESQSLNQEIQEMLSPLRDAQTAFSDVIRESGELQVTIDKFNRIEDLEKRRDALLAANVSPVNPQVDPSASVSNPQVDLSASVLDAFAQKVQQLLQTWNFPGSERVHFDETAKDVVIGGQPRISRGKGFRAITHAAVTIGLMEFCRERNLSHPGFAVLDSPLLAYYAPESAEDSLVGSDLKVRFYKYLAQNHVDSQIIIIENEHPPSDIEGQIGLIDFTKNPHEGRYGFFPHVE